MKHRLVVIGITILILIWTPGFSEGNPAASQIESINDDGVVVLSDVTFSVASDARFFAQDETSPIPFSTFKEGDWVEFSVNSDGEIDEMWLSSE